MLLFFSLGCSNQEDRDNQKTSTQLEQLRDSLLTKERELTLKEQALTKREQALDSTSTRDSVGIINSDLMGKWQVKMTCVETNCEGSAIGDVRTENWNISYQNDVAIVEALSNGKVQRLYTGLYNGKELQLVSSSAPSETTIAILLTPQSEISMRGRREITQAGGCKIFYRLELDKL